VLSEVPAEREGSCSYDLAIGQGRSDG